MENAKTAVQQRIEAHKPLLLAEVSPPCGADPAAVQELARRWAGKVHALGISDNRERVSMAAVAAASLVMAEGVEPILHVVTRDRNRVALVSDALGAGALGIRNLFCTSGSHQMLGSFRAAKSVFDIDPVQLLQLYSHLGTDASLVGQPAIPAGAYCLGAVAAPYADPLDLQIVRLGKKQAAGARYFVTQPVFDTDRFGAWWQEVVRLGLNEKAAFVACIQPLASAEQAAQIVAKRLSGAVPQPLLDRMAAASAPAAAREAGIRIAVETIGRLQAVKGLGGFQIAADGDADAALEVLDKAGLGTD